MASELRDLLREAAAEPAGAFDVDDLRRRGRRVRRRRRLATAGGAASVVLVLVAVVVGGDQLTGPSDVAIEDARPTPSDAARQVVAEGTFGDDLGSWTMRAWTQGDDELCLQGPLGSTCGHLLPGRNPFRVTSVGTGERDGVPVGCAVGAVRPRVATVEVAFASGTGRLLTPAVNDTFGLRFYATCWTGQRSVHEVNGLDAEGQQVASVGYDVTVEATESTEPEPQNSPWCPDEATVVAQRHGGRALVSAVSSTVGAVREWQARPVEPAGDGPAPEPQAQPWLQELEAGLEALVCVYATAGGAEQPDRSRDGEHVSVVVVGDRAMPYQIFDASMPGYLGPDDAQPLQTPRQK